MTTTPPPRLVPDRPSDERELLAQALYRVANSYTDCRIRRDVERAAAILRADAAAPPAEAPAERGEALADEFRRGTEHGWFTGVLAAMRTVERERQRFSTGPALREPQGIVSDSMKATVLQLRGLASSGPEKGPVTDENYGDRLADRLMAAADLLAAFGTDGIDARAWDCLLIYAPTAAPAAPAAGWPQTVVVSSGDMCFTADWDGEYFVTRSPIALAEAPRVTGGREAKYEELLYAVASKWPGESRHDTALRYIRERENRSDGPATAARQAATGGGEQ